MRKIAAHLIFPISRPPIKNGCITVSNDGTIIEISENEEFTESQGVEFYSGVIIPGMVNAHCHLEYSHLLEKYTPYQGLTEFLRQQIENKHHYSQQTILDAAEKAIRKMFVEGVVAVGDIANSDICFELKHKADLYTHTFIECLGLIPTKSEKIIAHLRETVDAAMKNQLAYSITLHASYSVSEQLKNRFLSAFRPSILSFHNQEGKSEEDLFVDQQGSMKDLFEYLKLPLPNLDQHNSLQQLLSNVPTDTHLLLVHNTYTTLKDLNFLYHKGYNNIHFVLCPKSNHFIEKKYPDIALLSTSEYSLALGTDSYASTNSYNILDEIKVLLFQFPFLSFETVLRWATIGGAKALLIEDIYGSIEIGKRPHLVLLSPFDFRCSTITSKTTSKLLC